MMDSAAQSELMNALSALHLGGKYSDLTITCNYKQWAVHKAIVCSRSGFFDGACSHQFREAETGVIDLSEDDECAVEQMIHFLYYLDYLNENPRQRPSAMFRHRAHSHSNRAPKNIDFSQIEDPLLAQAGFYNSQPSCPAGRNDWADKPFQSPPRDRADSPHQYDQQDSHAQSQEAEEDTEQESHLVLHAQVYALGEKYDIPCLKQLAKQKFEMAAACYYDAAELAEAIELVYQSTVDTDRGLRDVVVQLFTMHPQLAQTQDMYAVIKDTPGLALDLWKVERGLR